MLSRYGSCHSNPQRKNTWITMFVTGGFRPSTWTMTARTLTNKTVGSIATTASTPTNVAHSTATATTTTTTTEAQIVRSSAHVRYERAAMATHSAGSATLPRSHLGDAEGAGRSLVRSTTRQAPRLGHVADRSCGDRAAYCGRRFYQGVEYTSFSPLPAVSCAVRRRLLAQERH